MATPDRESLANGLGVSYSKGNCGTIYPYFFYCLGRNKKRTPCDLPYVPASASSQTKTKTTNRTSQTTAPIQNQERTPTSGATETDGEPPPALVPAQAESTLEEGQDKQTPRPLSPGVRT
jgi:hypothetical protein